MSQDLVDCRAQHFLFRVALTLNPGLGGLWDVAYTIIFHERIQSNRVCCFLTLDAIRLKNLDLEITKAVIVPCGEP